MLAQTPMLSSPLKQTNEVDWITPLKAYIRDTYGDDPERYNEECAMLNRLRQDMRGAGKDSAAGRDLLYRYYGQLELLDLRFPVDENHIKISFTWFDAFTHKPTSQYSLAYEKASIIFNISAVLSCHAAHQNRFEDTGLKTAYHSFQAAAGMFTYINENFLHAPSMDLSRETVKTLIALMLAQGQEVFLEKQIADDKKVGLLAKLASQAAFLYAQALEGVQENVTKAIFERVWLLVAQAKASHMAALAQYYQALADNDANAHGVAVCRLQVAEGLAREANRFATAIPSSVPSSSNLTSDTGVILSDITKRHLVNVQEKYREFSKDNDFIYHQPVPGEASLSPIPKLPAAKAIPVSELYQGQDIQRIIGPDIFQKIVPMAVTESASLYDEEKAKVVRAETERVEVADDEMEASLDYLKLPESLNVLKGGMDQDVRVDPEFRRWCEELAGHQPFNKAFDQLSADKSGITSRLDQSQKQLDMEESVCEKMRSKYGDDWTQQPSSRLTATLRSDIKNYKGAIEEASTSDAQLFSTFRTYEADFDEMRSAGETDEADVLYQRAMIKAGAARAKGKGIGSPRSPQVEGSLIDDDFEGGPSVADQISNVEELVKKLNLIKRERAAVLKDLKEKVHNDDISNVLILNKRAITNQEAQLFKTELEKFRPHQTRILQANHKQTSLMKELTRVYGDLLQDKRVRAEQSKYEAFSRQRNSVISKYRKVYQAFNDLVQGLMRAQAFYTEMKDTVDSLHKNVETFVNNRRSEGGQLLSAIEQRKSSHNSGLVDWERERLHELMDRMSVNPSESPVSATSPSRKTVSRQFSSGGGNAPTSASTMPPELYTSTTPMPPELYASPPPITTQFANPMPPELYASPPPTGYLPTNRTSANGSHPTSHTYNPNQYGPVSPPPLSAHPAHQPHYQSAPVSSPQSQSQSQNQSQSHNPNYFSPPPGPHHSSHQPYASIYSPSGSRTPQQPPQPGQPGWQPPPPPPGPPPSAEYAAAIAQGAYPSGPGGYAQQQGRAPSRGGQGQQGQQGQQGPWAGLEGWK